MESLPQPLDTRYDLLRKIAFRLKTAGLVSPDSLPDPVLWFDPLHVTTGSDFVILDQGTGGNNAVQPSGNPQPTITTDPGGSPRIEFPVNGDGSTTPTFPALNTFSIVALLEYPDKESGATRDVFRAGAVLTARGDAGAWMLAQGGVPEWLVSYYTAGKQLFVLRCTGEDDPFATDIPPFRVNAGDIPATPIGNDPMTSITFPNSGQLLYEFRVYDGILTDAQVAIIEAELNSNFSLGL